ncbi:Transcription factor atf21 [Aspergillus sp. HF37]|nr:Transcription factor atf21 [Aspergillus sp. HF37]
MVTISMPAAQPPLDRPDLSYLDADPPLLANSDAFSPDFLLFSPQEDSQFPLTLPEWSGKDEFVIGNPGLGEDGENSYIRNGQPTPPPRDDKPNATLATMAQCRLDGSPDQLDCQQRASSNNHPGGKSNNGGGKRRKCSKDSSTGSDEQPDEKVKRDRYLERNRVAASKCRQKKKEHTKGLESRFKEQSDKKDALMAEFAQLRLEVLGLKSKVLEHAKCGDRSIGRHLEQSAMTITQSESPAEVSTSPTGQIALSFGSSDPLQLDPLAART